MKANNKNKTIKHIVNVDTDSIRIIFNVEETDKDKEINLIRKSGIPKPVEAEIFYSHTFDLTDCSYCMNYDSVRDICKCNISYSAWLDMHKTAGGECPSWTYIYSLDE